MTGTPKVKLFTAKGLTQKMDDLAFKAEDSIHAMKKLARQNGIETRPYHGEMKAILGKIHDLSETLASKAQEVEAQKATDDTPDFPTNRPNDNIKASGTLYILDFKTPLKRPEIKDLQMFGDIEMNGNQMETTDEQVYLRVKKKADEIGLKYDDIKEPIGHTSSCDDKKAKDSKDCPMKHSKAMKMSKDQYELLNIELDEIVATFGKDEVQKYRDNIKYAKDQFTSFVWGMYHKVSPNARKEISKGLVDAHLQTALKMALKEYK